MRLTSRLALALPLLGSALAQHDEDGRKTVTAVAIPHGYIIEFRQGSLKKRQEEIVDTAGIEVLRSFDSEVFSGVSVQTEEYDIDSLAQLADVVKVWPNVQYTLPTIESRNITVAESGNWTTHVSTRVQQLHDEGILGKGVKIGVVDTGIWYNHEALGGGFGDGFKVAGGHDFVGDGNFPLTAIEPDEDPLDIAGHGTHVSGIIAGSAPGWKGVAPEATLYAYKVFSAISGTTEEVLVDAFLRAWADGVDIITSSIGGLDGWADSAWATVASRLVDEGVVVTISAANGGEAGPFWASSGSSGKNVLAIASSEGDLLPANPLYLVHQINGTNTTIEVGYFPATVPFAADLSGLPVIALDYSNTLVDEACQPYPENSHDLSNSIVLIRRGTCNYIDKQRNVEALGAKYVLFYTDTRTAAPPGGPGTGSQIASILAETGASITKTLAAGGQVFAEFPTDSSIRGIKYGTAVSPSRFTSWGGLFDLQLKPDISAPGGYILSTWLNNGWNVIGGTSMSCPYVAGVAALWISAHGGRSVHGKGVAKKIHQRVVSSGNSLPWSSGSLTSPSWDAPVIQIGNGHIDAWKIVEYDTHLASEAIALNDTRYFERYHPATITNEGKSPITYTWSVKHGAGIDGGITVTTPSGEQDVVVRSFSQLSPKTLEAKVSLPRSFTLQPGESKTVSINFENPDRLGWDAAHLPFYGGKVRLSGSNGDELSIPFFGLGTDLRREFNPLSLAGFPLSVSGPDEVPIETRSTYSFDLSLEAQSFLKINDNLRWGTRQLRFDIFESGWKERQWKYPPTVGENGYIGSATTFSGADSYAEFDPATLSTEDLLLFPRVNLPRTPYGYTVNTWWFGKLANGTQIANGRYHIRYASLKPFGRPEAADNWEVYRTPEIEVTGHY